MVVNMDGTVHLIIVGLSTHVFGSILLTSIVLLLFFVMMALLIRIPVPFALAIPIPFAVVLTAYGYLDVIAGSILTTVFFVLVVISFLGGIGAK